MTNLSLRMTIFSTCSNSNSHPIVLQWEMVSLDHQSTNLQLLFNTKSSLFKCRCLKSLSVASLQAICRLHPWCWCSNNLEQIWPLTHLCFLRQMAVEAWNWSLMYLQRRTSQLKHHRAAVVCWMQSQYWQMADHCQYSLQLLTLMLVTNRNWKKPMCMSPEAWNWSLQHKNYLQL